EGHRPKQYPPDRFLFYGLANDSTKERGLVFILFDESGNRRACEYPWNKYSEAMTFVCAELGDRLECQGSWLTVNRDFLSRILAQSGA
ncbi:MAG: hypothetical protein ACRD2L_12310, partial [Terriglobia bacterium]